MKYADRIEILNSKYKEILKQELLCNICIKQSLGSYYERTGNSYTNLTESCITTGTLEKRENNFFTAVPFVREWEGITIFIDRFIDEGIINAYGSSFNAVLVSEPESIISDTNERVDKNIDKIDVILTNKDYLLKKYPHKAIWVPTAIPTIGKKYTGVNCSRKNKLMSIILSNKNSAPGHKLRHQIATDLKQNHEDQIDILGSGGAGKVNEKGELLERYFYSIVIENEKQENYYTEKILDCLITGTIPIYWGANIIKEHFNPNGIFFFDSIQELQKILQKISQNPLLIYNERIDAICENYRAAQLYKYLDDIFLLEIIDFIRERTNKKDLLKKLYINNFY